MSSFLAGETHSLVRTHFILLRYTVKGTGCEFHHWCMHVNKHFCLMVTSSHYAVSDLRVYPPRFAQAVSGLMERMKSTCKGQPEIPAGQTPVAIEVMELEWECDPELWSFVDFSEIFTYLRGSKRLNIPDSWKHIIPRKLPIETSGGSSD